MGLLNKRNLPRESATTTQESALASVPTNTSVESVIEDVELNEEQLDIISGGNDSKILIKE